MEINASITFLVGSEETIIRVEDIDAVSTFLEIKLTPEQLSSALSRLGNTPVEKCTLINDLSILGKKREHKTVEIPTGLNTISYHGRDVICKPIIDEFMEENYPEWTPSYYLRAQDSFFTNNDETWLRITIMRWVDNKE